MGIGSGMVVGSISHKVWGNGGGGLPKGDVAFLGGAGEAREKVGRGREKEAEMWREMARNRGTTRNILQKARSYKHQKTQQLNHTSASAQAHRYMS